MPVVLAFRPPEIDKMEWNLHLYLMTGVFVADLIVNLRTTYFDGVIGDEIVEGKKLFLKYSLTLQFAFDLISTIPWDLALKGSVSDDIDGALSCLRMLKIVRIGSISTLISSLKFERGTKALLKLLYLIMIMYLFVHV